MFISQRFGRYTGVMRSDVGVCERASMNCTAVPDRFPHCPNLFDITQFQHTDCHHRPLDCFGGACTAALRVARCRLGLLSAPRFLGHCVIQPKLAPASALNAPKSAPKRLKRLYEFSMNHAFKTEKYISGARGCSLKYHVRESCALNYVPRPMEYARSDDNLPYLHFRAVGDRSSSFRCSTVQLRFLSY